MHYEHFGMLLQELRKKHNMSREKLAENICTTKQIYRLEKGTSEPSIYLLHQLSIKFNMDLNEYYKMYFTKNTLVGLEGTKAINSAIESENLDLIKTLIEKYQGLEDFKQGHNLRHIYYGKALLSALSDKDYTTSLQYCFQGLLIECAAFQVDTIPDYTYSNTSLALINCTSQNYFAMDKQEEGMKVLQGLLAVLETHHIYPAYPMFQASPFAKKLYQTVLYNLSIHFFHHGDIKDSFLYVNKGIAFSTKEYSLKLLPELYEMKLKILYQEENFDEAKICYNHTLHLYKVTRKDVKLAALVDLAKSDYPEVLRN
ncbi:hypothetical protein acsn021_02910 [Anaerocolumna cellulosilytica]|uniref:Uncharacterized protein n=1 Tax=Anaerocolumna cellulosilytica TaxID=433286 RepID=A0A6S6QZL5_9FIRM|nr:helix-turn-helix transcriptional regulator [Anaerocolumna cellulosilytica]MBB5196877.1 transcriptional regulator with XRE-family HTH domain [Anaerocolumna cellulosilytica]BCJ92722.1 hypothetical protein acsn021_02910 [Anaerocolumna cellulosilytica]